MKEDIKEVLEQFKYGNYSIEQATNELFDLYNVRQRSELLLFADYSESDKTSQATDECVDNYLDQKQ